MFDIGIAADEAANSTEERRWRREARSAWLRLSVFAILIILVREHDGNLQVHALVILGYASVTSLALALALLRQGPDWSGTAFVVADAGVVIALFHEHLFGPNGSLTHNLTTSSLAIAFLLLTHVALRLIPRLVLLFAGIVLTGWLSFLAITALAPHRVIGTHEPVPLMTEGALAAAFAFAAFVAFLLTRDHNTLLQHAVKIERRRQNLSRFFSPDIVIQLQAGSDGLELQRRQAAVMFIDLRSFTTFAEAAEARALAEILIEFRLQVTDAVFEYGGTIDKFIGDGVMAVFGQPKAQPDDAQRALYCALKLKDTLARWSDRRRRAGKSSLDVGIGLHVGSVIGGVVTSGQHDEFTVFGDAVNVADRLQRLSKMLGASLVVSSATLEQIPGGAGAAQWVWKDEIALDGRSGILRIAYLALT